jgi:hypothetical protein
VTETPRWPTLAAEPLCYADFRVEGGIADFGRSPFSERRVGFISGGEFHGDRLSGEILPGGGNWPLSSRRADGATCGTFDARTVFKTHDGVLIHVTYSGRSFFPADVLADVQAKKWPIDRTRYYMRITPEFETGDPRYDWLNGVVAVGYGERMEQGVRHWIFAIR